MVAEDTRQWMAKLGFKSIDEMVGHSEVLGTDKAIHHWKSDGLDLTPILRPATRLHEGVGTRCMKPQDHGIELSLDVRELLPRCQSTLDSAKPIRIELPIQNTNRTVGTILSHEIAKR